jgi:hypothetical protein
MRTSLKKELGRHIYEHLIKELPFIKVKLTGHELNVLVATIARWFVDEGADPILLARAVIKIMNGEDIELESCKKEDSLIDFDVSDLISDKD